MSEFRREKIWPKILFRQDTAQSLDFSLDVISLLVSQFDLQNKKYCISLHLVVYISRLLSRSLHPRVVYSSRAVYSSTMRERRIRRSGDGGRSNIRRKGDMSTGRMWNSRR